jgi:hypothetical protein
LGGLGERARERERLDRQERSEHEHPPSSSLSLSSTPLPPMPYTQATTMTTNKPHHIPGSLPNRGPQPWHGVSADVVSEFGEITGRMDPGNTDNNLKMETRDVVNGVSWDTKENEENVNKDTKDNKKVNDNMKDTGYKAMGLKWRPTLNYLGLMLATRVGPSFGHEPGRTSPEQPKPADFSLAILLLMATIFGWWLRGLIGTRLQCISAGSLAWPFSGWTDFSRSRNSMSEGPEEVP